MKKRIAALLLAAGIGALALSGCAPTSSTVSANLSTAADEFEIDRRVVFFNGITDTYLLTIEGRCSIVDGGGQLETTCKIGPDEYKKHFLGLSDNVSYFVEQLAPVDVDEYHYRVMFKPEAIIPDIDLNVSGRD